MEKGVGMTTGTAGIWNQAPSQTEARTASMTSKSNGTEDSAGNNQASIAANDFLTLLVTEMKNQDPTATTDPNEYVNQLVQVNSLQQLISINETLKAASGTTPRTDVAPGTHADGTVSHAMAAAKEPGGSSKVDLAVQTSIPGNLSKPAETPGALRISTALGTK